MRTMDPRHTILRWTNPFLSPDGDSGGAGDDDRSPTGEKGKKDGDDGDKGFTPITSQDQLDDILTRRLSRARRSLAAEIRAELEEEIREEMAAEAAKEAEDFKALYEAEQKKRERLEADKADRELEELRKKVASDVGLPEKSMEFLTGKSESELRASAKKLMEIVTPREPVETDAGRTTTTTQKAQEKKDYEDANYWFRNNP